MQRRGVAETRRPLTITAADVPSGFWPPVKRSGVIVLMVLAARAKARNGAT